MSSICAEFKVLINNEYVLELREFELIPPFSVEGVYYAFWSMAELPCVRRFE